ncbi:MAG: alpha/beta hydrolase fold domain-containing protein [Pseudomonadota bacterium]|nr:alpha/beta hydrolase fold domain-containing protein [Pseudomonadota bacterium]
MTAGDLFDPQMRLAMAMKAAIAERHGLVSEGTGVTIAEARRQYAKGRAWWNADAPCLARVIDDHLPGPHGPVPVRRYYPTAADALPAILYFHGGGNVVGDLDTHDKVTRLIARASGCAVVAVDYRLAPEHKFPRPLDDCLATVDFLRANGAGWDIRADRLAVAGDSAGARWALHALIAERDSGRRALAAGALIYGAYYGDIAFPSYAKFGGPEFDLPVADLAVYREMLLDPARPDDLARLRLDDADLADLPPVHVYGAGLDPLLDDSVRLAAALRAAGNAGDLAVYPGVVHAFIHYSRMVDQAGRLIDDVSAALARDLAP